MVCWCVRADEEVQPRAVVVEEGMEMPDLDSKLLLRTQNARFSHNYSFFAVDPRPGSLIFFPGYVPHCVFPTSRDARISVAANITRKGGEGTMFGVSGWCNVNKKGDFNMLHTHGDALFAAVLYV